ncbi:14112_t:CDS:2, partial [Acaulospora colombiana]
IMMLWGRSYPTMLARSRVAKALVVSRSLYLMTVNGINKRQLETMEKNIRKFIWQGQKGPVSWERAIQHRDEGGIGAPCVKSLYEATKVMWIKRWLTPGEDRPKWAWAANAILEGAIRSRPMITKDAITEWIEQRWHEQGNSPLIPESVRHMMKAARTYNVKISILRAPPELKEAMPAFFHPGTTAIAINNTEEAKCLRENHRVTTIADLTKVTNNENGQLNSNCELGTPKCKKIAEKLINNLPELWNPNSGSPHKNNLYHTVEQKEEYAHWNIRTRPIPFNPDPGDGKTTLENVRIFGKRRGYTQKIRIATIYVPNDRIEKINALNTLREEIRKTENAHKIILTGDFNMVEEERDRYPIHEDDKQVCKTMKKLKTNLGLIDGWRETHEDDIAFTWKGKSGEEAVFARIDRIYASARMMHLMNEWEIKEIESQISDHQAVTVKILEPDPPLIGKGEWRLALHTMEHKHFKTEAEIVLNKAARSIEKYHRIEYRTSKNPELLKHERMRINPQMIWENYKQGIRRAAMEAETIRNKAIRKEINEYQRQARKIRVQMKKGRGIEEQKTLRKALDEAEKKISKTKTKFREKAEATIEAKWLKAEERATKLWKNGMILALDQEKAYDRIDHKYLWEVMEKFGLPKNFIQKVKNLYTNAETAIRLNGCVTEPFPIKRGVRQGDPLSCLLYNIAIEPLFELIRQSDIRGIQIHRSTTNARLSAYADDTTVFLCEDDNPEILMNCIDIFCKASTAKFNQEKTEIIPVGTKDYRANLYENRKFGDWQIPDTIRIARDKEAIRILGSWQGNDVNANAKWEEIIEKQTRIMMLW